MSITNKQYREVQKAFDYFNRELFSGEMPDVMLTFSRHNKAYGFFVPNQWREANATNPELHEIALNPDYMSERDLRSFYGTMVHEMCHLQQQEDGTAPRRCYHNKDFSKKMQACGLITSSTGEPGGKATGQKISHYIQDNGAYDKAFQNLPEDCIPSYICEGLLGETKKKVKKAKRITVKYVCPICGAALKGKPGLNIKCVDCDEFMLQHE